MAIKAKASTGMTRRELLEERQKKLKEKNSGGLNYFLVKDGVNRMRFPRIDENFELCQEVSFIFLSKELGGVISPSTFGEPCAITEEYQRLKASSDEDDRKFAEKLKPKRRYMGPVLRYKDENGKELDTEAGVKLVLLTGGLYDETIGLWLDVELGDFTDPLEGYDLKFKRTGSGQMDTSYTVTPCKPTKLAKEFAKEVYNPEEMVRELVPTYEETEELLAKFLGVRVEEEDEPKPKKRPAKPTSADLDDEDEEEETPAPKKKKKKKPLAY